MGPDCGGADGMLPFIAIAATLLVAAAGIAALRVTRLRA
jgi:hypothetical protein